MPKRNHVKLLALVGLTLGLFLSGCSKQESSIEGDQLSAEEKVAQAEKQLEEAKKELAATEQQTQAGEKPPAPQAQLRTITLPSGTAIAVRTITSLSTKTHKTGEPFDALLDQTLEIDGVVVAGRGAAVTGVVSNSDPGGRFLPRLRLQHRSRPPYHLRQLRRLRRRRRWRSRSSSRPFSSW